MNHFTELSSMADAALNLLTIRTEYWRKPVPTNRYDWDAWVDELNEDSPVGHGPTEDAAVEDLLEKLDDK